MTAQDCISHEIVTFDGLKALAAAHGPSITMAVPLPNPLEIDVRLKNAIRGIQRQLTGYRVDPAQAESLIAPVQDLANTVEAEGLWARAIILFRSPELFRYYLLRGPVKELYTVENRFQIRPVLGAVSHETEFYLLGLSRQHVRLFHCTQSCIRKLSTGEAVPQNMDTWLNTRQPDHVLDNRSAAGPSVGHMKGVLFGTSTDRDRDEEYLAHFFKAVEKGVTAIIRKDPAALVLAGVEYELATYRRINSYSRTLEKVVSGSPDSMTDQTLHDRALDVILQVPSEPLQKALADIRNHAGTSQVTTDARNAIRAAWQGRVLDLLIAEDAEEWGCWDEAAQNFAAGGRQEELLNAAALQTLRHNGRAFVLTASDMPVRAARAAAFLRF
jgi:hypothetical protein